MIRYLSIFLYSHICGEKNSNMNITKSNVLGYYDWCDQHKIGPNRVEHIL